MMPLLSVTFCNICLLLIIAFEIYQPWERSVQDESFSVFTYKEAHLNSFAAPFESRRLNTVLCIHGRAHLRFSSAPNSPVSNDEFDGPWLSQCHISNQLYPSAGKKKKRGILGLNDHEESLVLRGGWHNETELLYTHIKPWKYSFIRHSLDLCYSLGLLEPGSALTGWEAPNTSWHRHICWGYARTCLKICLFS